MHPVLPAPLSWSSSHHISNLSWSSSSSSCTYSRSNCTYCHCCNSNWLSLNRKAAISEERIKQMELYYVMWCSLFKHGIQPDMKYKLLDDQAKDWKRQKNWLSIYKDNTACQQVNRTLKLPSFILQWFLKSGNLHLLLCPLKSQNVCWTYHRQCRQDRLTSFHPPYSCCHQPSYLEELHICPIQVMQHLYSISYWTTTYGHSSDVHFPAG